MERFEIIYFELDNGECPVGDFIDSFDPKMKARLFMEMALLEEIARKYKAIYEGRKG